MKPDTFTPQWSVMLQDAVSRPGLLLAAYSAFHGYSIGNQLMAMVQCRQRGIDPGPIATFPGWIEKGRHVKKGERAIVLCMPLRFGKKDDPESQRLGFAYKPRWFVLAQTEGEPVEPPTIEEWIYERALAALSIVEQPFELLEGNTQGYARGREIAISPLAAVPHKTRFHELAHIVLGHTAEGDFNDTDRTPRSLREVEAEAVALICCETLGLPGADYCRGYIQNLELRQRGDTRAVGAEDLQSRRPNLESGPTREGGRDRTLKTQTRAACVIGTRRAHGHQPFTQRRRS